MPSSIFRVVVFGVTLAAATANPGDPCLEEDALCPHPTCPAPPANTSEMMCVTMPNPLALTTDGKCCHRSACDHYDCPAQNGCQCDGGATGFCDDKANAQGTQGNVFDCTKDDAAFQCGERIQPYNYTKQVCDCLVRDCKTMSGMLMGQASGCVQACESPSGWTTVCPSSIPSNKTDWCSWYAVWLCVTDADPDQCGNKPQKDDCEKHCWEDIAGETDADQRLKSFLLCMDICDPPPGTNKASLVV